MTSAGTTSRQGARRWPSLPRLTPGVVAALFGILCGFVALVLSESATRWQVYALAGLVVAVLTLAFGVRRRQLVTYFIVGLSLNVHYYLTHPEEVLYRGNSSPTYFSIPLVLIPAAVLAGWMALEAMTDRTRLRWGLPVSKFALLVIATATISAMLSSVTRYGIYCVVEMLQYFFIYLVAVNIVRTEDDLALVIRLLLVTLSVQCAIFLVQTTWGTTFTLAGRTVHYGVEGELVRASGTVGVTPAGYAIFVEPLVFTALALWRARDSGVSRVWSGCLAAVGSVTVILTLNRSSWFALVLGIAVVEVLCRRRRIARRLPRKLAGVIILLAVVVIPLIIPRLEKAHGDDWNSRYDLMRIAVRMIAGNPIVGVGPGGYPYHLGNYTPSDFSGWLWVVHNQYLLTWAERGLLGLIAWLAWIRAGFRQAVRATTSPARQFQAFGIGCVAGMVGLLWEYLLNLYIEFSSSALLWCLFGLLLAGNEFRAKVGSCSHSTDHRRLPLREASVGR